VSIGVPNRRARVRAGAVKAAVDPDNLSRANDPIEPAE
jgi:hypothetical protein